jgi:hypothetical protein
MRCSVRRCAGFRSVPRAAGSAGPHDADVSPPCASLTEEAEAEALEEEGGRCGGRPGTLRRNVGAADRLAGHICRLRADGLDRFGGSAVPLPNGVGNPYRQHLRRQAGLPRPGGSEWSAGRMAPPASMRGEATTCVSRPSFAEATAILRPRPLSPSLTIVTVRVRDRLGGDVRPVRLVLGRVQRRHGIALPAPRPPIGIVAIRRSAEVRRTFAKSAPGDSRDSRRQ